jgi:exodeoxyribonuclease V alpha subunit
MAYNVRYDRTVFHAPDTDYCVMSVKTTDNAVPVSARSVYRHRDGLIRFTATGRGLPRTDAVELALDGEWESSKHGLQLKRSKSKRLNNTLRRSVTRSGNERKTK